jgi:hypothetical protein
MMVLLEVFLRQSKGNRRKILALVCKACVGEEHAEVRRHPTARAVRGRVTSQRDQIFRTASARVASCPDRRKGAPSVGRVRAALLQGAREGALPARPARGLCARLGGHRCSLIHATATLGRWACMRATRAARRMRSKLNRTRS